MTTYTPVPGPTGYNVNPPPDDASQTAANAVEWAKHIGKIGDPIKNWIDEIQTRIQQTFALAGLSTGEIGGLCPTPNVTTPATQIDVKTGRCRDAADTFDIALASTLTKRIDASWASGTGLGGFPSNLTLANDTWYHFFVISDQTNTDAGFDTSLGASNLLADSGYSKYRRVGSIYYGTATIVGYQAIEEGGGAMRVFWNDPVAENVINPVSVSGSDLSLRVPPGFSVEAEITATVVDPAIVNVIVNPKLDPGQNVAPINGRADITLGAGTAGSFRRKVMSDTVSQISVRSDQSGTSCTPYSYGFLDFRRS